MTPEVQIALWGIAASAPLCLNLATNRRVDALGLSAMLLATWCVGRFMAVFFTLPESMTLYPVEDALCGGVAILAWKTQKAPWKLLLAALFVVQCCLHASFWLAWNSGSKSSLLFYITCNNAIFALQLITVSWGALAHVAGSVVGRVSRGARIVHTERNGP